MNPVIASLRLVLLSLLFAAPVFAGTAMETPISIPQPDGTTLTIRIRGDERQNWIELVPTGHTVMLNPLSGVWEYAEAAPDGTLRPSGVKAEPAWREAPSFPKGLRPSPNLELQREGGAQTQLSTPLAATAAATGPATRNLLVVLVNFSNRAFRSTAVNWYGKIFSTVAGMKTVSNFYRDNSMGAVAIAPAPHQQSANPAGVVTVKLPDAHPNYSGSISYTSDAAIANHALAQIAPYINFSGFDTNSDGTLDPSELALHFVYAGYESSGTYKSPGIWAHSWSGGSIMAGSTVVRSWSLTGELNDGDLQHPIGVVVHELGHTAFSLIDLYDTTHVNQGMGYFSTMAAGSWGADVGEPKGTTPVALDAWSRQSAGWLTPVEPEASVVSVPASLSSAAATFKAIHSALNDHEYYLFENRQPVGWDTGLRSYLGSNWLGGILISHVDDDIASNDYLAGSHQKVVPVQAYTGWCDMLALNSTCRGHASTLFYQWNNTSWSPTGSPDSDYYNGYPSGFSLSGISPPLSTMTAVYSPDASPPMLTAFALPAASTSLTVPITSLSATDNVGVAAYLLSESSAPPSPSSAAWSSVKPASYTFASEGMKTLYAWARDRAGGISNSLSGSVKVSAADSLPPEVTAFSVPATSSSLTVPITTLTATDNVGVGGYLITETSSKPSAAAPGWHGARPASYTFAAGGGKTLYAWAKDAAGNVSKSLSAALVIAPALPAPWQTQDVGAVALPGSASHLDGIFTVEGAGADIWGTSDTFRFVYQQMTGDGEVVARVASLENTHPYAKAGVMIRQALTAGSMHAFMDVTAGKGAEFVSRAATGGTTTAAVLSGITPPYWVRLARSGNTFTGYVSSDGVRWVRAGSSTMNMGGPVYFGFAVTSHNNSALCTATFSQQPAPATDTVPPTVTAFTVPATSSSLSVPVSTLTASDNVGVTGYLLTESSLKPGAGASGWSAAKPVSYAFASAGSKTLYAWAKDAAGNVSSPLSAAVTVSTTLPAPWQTADVGSVGVRGSASYLNGVFTLHGSGADIWGTADAFRFVYKTMTGDGQITARVASLQNTNQYAKGGVMMRGALSAGSVHALMDVTPQRGGEFSRRAADGGSTTVTTATGIAAPYWVRLVRSGNTFTGYLSSDGSNWIQTGSSTIMMSSTIYVGLAVNSHNNSALCTASIDNLQ